MRCSFSHEQPDLGREVPVSLTGCGQPLPYRPRDARGHQPDRQEQRIGASLNSEALRGPRATWRGQAGLGRSGLRQSSPPNTGVKLRSSEVDQASSASTPCSAASLFRPQCSVRPRQPQRCLAAFRDGNARTRATPIVGGSATRPQRHPWPRYHSCSKPSPRWRARRFSPSRNRPRSSATCNASLKSEAHSL